VGRIDVFRDRLNDVASHVIHVVPFLERFVEESIGLFVPGQVPELIMPGRLQAVSRRMVRPPR
jgi:hypothetical protein